MIPIFEMIFGASPRLMELRPGLIVPAKRGGPGKVARERRRAAKLRARKRAKRLGHA